MAEAVLNAGGDPLITDETVFAAHTVAHNNDEHKDHTIVNAALTHAMLTDNLEMIREGANVNHQNDTSWTVLALAVATLINELTANVNIPENDGWSPLMFAANNNFISMAEMLLAAGANGDGNMVVEVVLNASGDPLITNSAGCDTYTHGANVNHHNDAGWTVLALAVNTNPVQEVSTLINELTANVNIPENDGWSPLMFAANNNFISMAEILLAAGANVSYKNDKGVGAIDLARTEKFPEMVELLTPAE
eukprot:gene33025-40756_t